jgi:hypothetical protein
MQLRGSGALHCVALWSQQWDRFWSPKSVAENMSPNRIGKTSPKQHSYQRKMVRSTLLRGAGRGKKKVQPQVGRQGLQVDVGEAFWLRQPKPLWYPLALEKFFLKLPSYPPKLHKLIVLGPKTEK